MVRLFTNLPEGVAFVLALMAYYAYAIVGLLAVRRLLDRAGVAKTQPVMAGWSTALAALTALLFTFVIANLWQSANLTRNRVDGEAAAMRLLARDMAPAQRGLLRDYARSVVTDEWPLLCDGGGSPKTTGLLARLETQAKPVDPGVRGDFYTQLAALENLRAARLQAGSPSIPLEIWFALIVLSALLLGITFFGYHEQLGFQMGMTLVLATALATLFWLTVQLDFPFCGGTTVGPGAILQAVATL